MSTSRPTSTPEWWFIAVLVLITLPLVLLPGVVAAVPAGYDELRTLLRLYPLYVLVADWAAWVCFWPRRLMAWIMVALVVMSHAAVAGLYFNIFAQ